MALECHHSLQVSLASLEGDGIGVLQVGSILPQGTKLSPADAGGTCEEGVEGVTLSLKGRLPRDLVQLGCCSVPCSLALPLGRFATLGPGVSTALVTLQGRKSMALVARP